MFGKPKWLAVIQENKWVIAKVQKNREKINIIKFTEYHIEPELLDRIEESSDPAGQKAGGRLIDAKKFQTTGSSALKLMQWLNKEKIPLKRLQIAFSCQGVITRIITLPEIPQKDLNKLLTEQVAQYFTLNIEDYLVDYRVLDHFEEEGQKRQHVLLAALPKYQFAPLWKVLSETGIKPKLIDLSPDCLARLYGLKSFDDIAIVDLGHERIEFVILEKGIFFLYSDLQLSLEELRETVGGFEKDKVYEKPAVSELLNSIDQESAEVIKVDEPVSSDDQANPYENSNMDPKLLSHDVESSEEQYSTENFLRSEVENALMPVLRTLEEFLNFFAARHFGKPVDHIYITGEYADVPFLEDIFQVNLEVETSIGFPGGWRPQFGKQAEAYSKNWMKYGSLYGLAIRKE